MNEITLWLLGSSIFCVSFIKAITVKWPLVIVSSIFYVWCAIEIISLNNFYIFPAFSLLFTVIIVLSQGYGQLHDTRRSLFTEWLHMQVILIFLLSVSYFLIALQELNISLLGTWIALSGIIALMTHIIIFRNLRLYTPTLPKKTGNSEDSPTVSLLIPARNEDHALKDALHEAVLSDYEKLEILVLDDCSHDQTPEIIRSYANDGIRFIEGKPLEEDWLGKNHAQQQLATASNGEILLFCDVDIRLDAGAISRIVSIMEDDQLDMLAIMPSRRRFDFLATLLRPLTNFWLALLPHNFLQKRAALGVCYAIRSKTLNSLNQYQDVKNEIFPEFTFARRLKHLGRYKFFIDNNKLGVTTRKRFSSQEETLIRILYPALNQDLALILITLLGVGLVIGLPYLYIFSNIFALVTALLWSSLYAQAVATFHTKSATIALLQFPFLLLHEGLLMFVSIIKYRFLKVNWKERNICMPVLEVNESLPRLS